MLKLENSIRGLSFSRVAFDLTIQVLNDWFRRPEYIDILDYVRWTGCFYFFNEIPLNFLEL